MWPEYTVSNPVSKKLVILEGDSIYDENGKRLIRGEPSDTINWAVSNNVAVFLDSFFTDVNREILYDLVYREKTKVLANRKGEPIGARISENRRSTWICKASAWSIKELHPDRLKDLNHLFSYYRLGFRPTPSSLGTSLMRAVWSDHNLKRHTSLNVAAEKFIREHAVGGIVQTPGVGKHFNELLMFDMSSAWVSQYVIHPTGTAVFFKGDEYIHRFFEYFAKCTVFIPYELPLGPFPIRVGKKESKRGQRVKYPTKVGYYREVYLWGIQVRDCIEAGCYVSVEEGYGWCEYTTDNYYWSEEAYLLRKYADTEFIATNSKRINVASIGRNFTPRERFRLIGENERDGEESVVDNQGNSYNIYLRKEIDNTSAYMVHWYGYTIALCNHHVYKFALPFAKEKRLVAIDYDSVMVIEKPGERDQYIQKKSIAAFDQPPGSWLWFLLHNVKILDSRSFTSDELTKTPGRKVA